MNKIFIYSGYFSIAEYSAEEKVFYGKIDEIADLVTYKGDTMIEAERAFKIAVDEYFWTCSQTGKTPDRPHMGWFDSHINSGVHLRLAILAKQRNINLNQLVAEILANHVQSEFRQQF